MLISEIGTGEAHVFEREGCMFSVSLISLRIRTCSRYSNVTERALSVGSVLCHFNDIRVLSRVFATYQLCNISIYRIYQLVKEVRITIVHD